MGARPPGPAGRSRSRSSTSTTSSGSTTRAVTRPATRSSARRPRPSPAYMRRSDRAFRVGGDEFALDPARHRRRPGAGHGPPAARRLPRRRVRPRLRAHDLVLGRYQRRPVARARPRGALPPGRRRALLEQAPRPHLRDDLRPGASTMDRPPSDPPAELSAAVAQVAATGAIRAVFQPIFDLTTGAPRGFEGLIRPLPDSGFADPGLAVRGGRGDGPDRRARHRLPEHGHGDGRAPAAARVADGQPLAAHPRARRLQRPRPAAADRPPWPGPAEHRARADRARGRRGPRPAAPGGRGLPGRRDPASPPTTSVPATPGCGC